MPTSESSPGRYVAGIPAEWADFQARNVAFTNELPGFVRDIKALFVRTGETKDRVAITCFMLGRLCLEDFSEILLLASNGYGMGAFKLVRGLYERCVTARYLRRHPEEHEDYLDWEAFSKGKAARAVLELSASTLTDDAQRSLAVAVAASEAVRPKFVSVACRDCGRTAPRASWSKLDFASMARAVGGRLLPWLPEAYYEPLRHAHATAGAVDARVIRSENHFSFQWQSQRHAADAAVRLAHGLLLDSVEFVVELFPRPEDASTLVSLRDSYARSWGAECPGGLSVEGGVSD